MSDDQAQGKPTGDSAAGSTSRRDTFALAMGRTLRLDRPHVDGSGTRSGRRKMVPTV